MLRSERERLEFLGKVPERDEDGPGDESYQFWIEQEAALEARRERVAKLLDQRRAWIADGGYYPRKCVNCQGPVTVEDADQVSRKSGGDDNFHNWCVDCYERAS